MDAKGREMLKRFDTFIFDWDGTIVRMRTLMTVNERIRRAVRTWNKDNAIKMIEQNKKGLKGRIAVEETKNETAAFLFDKFMVFSKPRLHNGSVKLLKLLRKKKKRIAVFSNGSGSRLIKELDRLGLLGMFDIVVSAKDIGKIKPNPKGLLRVIKAMGADPKRTIYLGDMVDDIFTADLAKVSSCAVSCGFDSRSTLASAEPDYLFKSIEELKEALSH